MKSIFSEIAAAACGQRTVEDCEIRQEFCFPPEFTGFQGHFPGHPIMPAFIQVMIIQWILEENNAVKMSGIKLSRAKFMSTFGPGDRVVAAVTPQKKDSYKARVYVEDRECSRFFLELPD